MCVQGSKAGRSRERESRERESLSRAKGAVGWQWQQAADAIGTKPSRLNNFVRTTFAISKLSNVAVNLAFSSHMVARSPIA